MARKQYGVFTRPGQTRRIAYSPAEAVEYEFNGWTRVADSLKKAPEPAPAAKAAAQPEPETAPAKATRGGAGK